MLRAQRLQTKIKGKTASRSWSNTAPSDNNAQAKKKGLWRSENELCFLPQGLPNLLTSLWNEFVFFPCQGFRLSFFGSFSSNLIMSTEAYMNGNIWWTEADDECLSDFSKWAFVIGSKYRPTTYNTMAVIQYYSRQQLLIGQPVPHHQEHRKEHCSGFTVRGSSASIRAQNYVIHCFMSFKHRHLFLFLRH